MPKFSKYLTGCAVHHKSSLAAIPDWFAYPSLQPFVFPTASSASSTGPNPREGASLLASMPPSSSARPPPHAPGHASGPTPMLTASATAVAPYDVPGTTTKRPAGSGGGAPFRLRARPGPGSAASSGARTVRLVDRQAGRTDPKVFFANERTFIQWLSAGMMMTSIGIAMIEFRAAQLRPPLIATASEVDPVTGATLEPITSAYAGTITDYMGGILVCSLALMIILYGLGVYLWRMRKLKRKDMTGYDDKFGPPVLVFAVVISVIIYITVHVNSSIDSTALPTVVLDGND